MVLRCVGGMGVGGVDIQKKLLRKQYESVMLTVLSWRRRGKWSRERWGCAIRIIIILMRLYG